VTFSIGGVGFFGGTAARRRRLRRSGSAPARRTEREPSAPFRLDRGAGAADVGRGGRACCSTGRVVGEGSRKAAADRADRVSRPAAQRFGWWPAPAGRAQEPGGARLESNVIASENWVEANGSLFIHDAFPEPAIPATLAPARRGRRPSPSRRRLVLRPRISARRSCLGAGGSVGRRPPRGCLRRHRRPGGPATGPAAGGSRQAGCVSLMRRFQRRGVDPDRDAASCVGRVGDRRRSRMAGAPGGRPADRASPRTNAPNGTEGIVSSVDLPSDAFRDGTARAALVVPPVRRRRSTGRGSRSSTSCAPWSTAGSCRTRRWNARSASPDATFRVARAARADFARGTQRQVAEALALAAAAGRVDWIEDVRWRDADGERHARDGRGGPRLPGVARLARSGEAGRRAGAMAGRMSAATEAAGTSSGRARSASAPWSRARAARERAAHGR